MKHKLCGPSWKLENQNYVLDTERENVYY
jgi:hypothetical protein